MVTMAVGTSATPVAARSAISEYLWLNHLVSSGQTGFGLCHAGLGLKQFVIKQVTMDEFAVEGFSETHLRFSDMNCVAVGAVSWFAS